MILWECSYTWVEHSQMMSCFFDVPFYSDMVICFVASCYVLSITRTAAVLIDPKPPLLGV